MNGMSSSGGLHAPPVQDPTRRMGEAPWTARLASEEARPPMLPAQLQQDIDEQVDWRVQQHLRARNAAPPDLLMPLVMLGSLIIGAATTGTIVIHAGAQAVFAMWLCLVLINVAWAVAWARRRP